MARRVVVGDLRVQRVDRKDGRRSWTIVWPEGTVHEEADRFLRVHDGSGTQKTYAYYLVDHLRWLERECLALGAVGLRDLERYMGVVGAEVRVPFGNLIERGLIEAGELLVDVSGRYAARVRADGSLISDLARGSIHQVAAALQHLPACNGWTFWCVKRQGKPVSIDQLRQRARQEMAG